MKRTYSLRQRLIVTTVLIVTLTSALFAGGVLFLKQQLEEVSFGSMVSEHMDILLGNPRAAHELMHPVFADWRFVRGADIESLPEPVRTLASGSYHSVAMNGHHYQLEVAQDDGKKAFLFYDISEWEDQEHQLLLTLVGGVLVVLLFALLMATSAANSILAPVRRLTSRLAMIHPDQRSVRIAGDFKDRDIGQIAQAFDAYSARIDQFVERERSFTAAASHELRTPLSVMIGAADVIELNQTSPVISRAVSRIQRACGEMQAFIEATLLLSREQQSGADHCETTDLCQVVADIVDDSREHLSRNSIDLERKINGKPSVEAPQSIVKITVANLLRNAIEHTPGGKIDIQVDQHRLEVHDNGEGIANENLPYIFDRSFSTKASGAGLGLNMVKRICDRFGWQITVESQSGKGTVVTVVFAQSE